MPRETRGNVRHAPGAPGISVVAPSVERLVGGRSSADRDGRAYGLTLALAGGVALACARGYRVALLVPLALVGVPLLIATWGRPRQSLSC